MKKLSLLFFKTKNRKKKKRELLAAVANQYRCQPTSSVRLDIDGLLFRPESIESLQQ